MARFRISVAAVLAAGLAAVAAPARAADFPVGHTVRELTVPGTARASPVGRRPPLVPDRAPAGPLSRLQLRAARPLARHRPVESADVDRRCRDRARGRRDRSCRRAVPGDRLLARQHQRPDRLRVHARADRRGRVHRRRARPHNNTQDDVRIDFVNTRPWPPAGRACSRVTTGGRTVLAARALAQHRRPRRGRLGDPGRAARLVRRPRRRGEGRRDRATRAAPSPRSPPPAAAPVVRRGPVPGGADACWPLDPEPRIQAIMGLAIGARPFTRGVNVEGRQGADAAGRGRLRTRCRRRGQRSAIADIAERRQDLRRRCPPAPTARSTRPTATRSQSPRADRQGRRRRRSSTSTRSTASSRTRTRAGPWTTARSRPSPGSPTSSTRRPAARSPRRTSRTGLDTDAVKTDGDAGGAVLHVALARAAGGGVSGTVPATLSLTLGPAGRSARSRPASTASTWRPPRRT